MKLKNQIIIAILGIILGIIISFQYKVYKESLSVSGSIYKKQSDITTALVKVTEEKKLLSSELETLSLRLTEIENAAAKDNAIIKNLNDLVRQYEIIAGLTNVSGEGVIITIDNPPESSEKSILSYLSDILKLINDLNAAGAEAISINEQRVIASTEIRNVGNNINVNNIPQSLPLVIKAIGEKNVLEGAINYRYGQITFLREEGFLIDLKTVDEILIPRYIGKLKFKYAKSIKEE